jgi:hypothetical protein
VGKGARGALACEEHDLVNERGETHQRGVSTAVGGRPVRTPERGRSVGHGGRQCDPGGALRWLDARGMFGGSREWP